MFDFRTRTKGWAYALRREHARWVRLVFLAGVVLILAIQALQPGTWQSASRLLSGSGWGPAEDGPQGPPIDNRLDLVARGTQPGAVVAQPGTAPEQEKPGSGQSIGGLSQEQLDSIQDDSPMRAAERDAWRQLLQILHDTDEATLRQKSSGRVTYSQLFRQSSAYRGELVTVRGEVRRAMRAGAPDNPWGAEHYYQLVVKTADNPLSPMLVYCLDLPEGFPLGMEVSEQAEITAFYFKRSAYKAHDTLRTAPTLVAKTVRWFPSAPAAVENEPPSLGGVLVMVAGVFVLAVAVAVVMIRRAGRTRRFEVARVVDLSALADEDDPPGP